MSQVNKIAFDQLAEGLSCDQKTILESCYNTGNQQTIKWRNRRESTLAMAFVFEPLWKSIDLEKYGIVQYDAFDDPDVSDLESLSVKYMRSNLTLKTTLEVVDKVYESQCADIHKQYASILKYIKFKISGLKMFPINKAAKALGAKGKCVYFELEYADLLSEKLVDFLKKVIKACCGVHNEHYQGLECGTSPFAKRLTLFYIKDEDEQSFLNAQKAFAHLIGSELSAPAWFLDS